jgi:hypothetical protein
LGPLYYERPPQHRHTLNERGKSLFNYIDNNYSKYFPRLEKIFEELLKLVSKKMVTFGSCKLTEFYFQITQSIESAYVWPFDYLWNWDLLKWEREGAIDVILHYQHLQKLEIPEWYPQESFEHFNYFKNNFDFYLIKKGDWYLFIPTHKEYNTLRKLWSKEINFKVLHDYKFVGLIKELDYTASLLKNHVNNEINHKFSYHNVDDVKRAVKAGEGIAIIPIFHFKDVKDAFFKVRNVNHLFQNYEREGIGIYINRNRTFPPLVQIAVDELMILTKNKPVFGNKGKSN